MSAPNAIKSEKLARLIGTASTPAIIDVRTQEDFDADPRLIPGALKRSHQTVSEWGKAHAGKSAIVVCHHGAKLSEGTAAWLRQLGADAVTLGRRLRGMGESKTAACSRGENSQA